MRSPRATPPVFRVVEREMRVYRRLWRGLVFSTFLTPVLFLAAIGLGLGALVDSHTGAVSGLDYLDFVAPGLLVASAAQIAAAEAMWPVLAGVKWIRFYEGVVATPIRARDISDGFVIWTALRTVLASSVFVFVAALLGAVPSAWGVFAVPAAALCAAACAAPLAAFSITQESDLAFPMIMRLVIVPLFLFSGTFFPVDQLPAWLRPFAALSPLWHGAELARAATTATWRPLAIAGHLLALTGFIAVGAWFGRRNFTRRLGA
jgi:lipooligosaccharide transport system permease protein